MLKLITTLLTSLVTQLTLTEATAPALILKALVIALTTTVLTNTATATLALAQALVIPPTATKCLLSTNTLHCLSLLRCLKKRQSSSINYSLSLMSSTLPCSMSLSSLTLTEHFSVHYHLFKCNSKSTLRSLSPTPLPVLCLHGNSVGWTTAGTELSSLTVASVCISSLP